MPYKMWIVKSNQDEPVFSQVGNIHEVFFKLGKAMGRDGENHVISYGAEKQIGKYGTRPVDLDKLLYQTRIKNLTEDSSESDSAESEEGG